MFVDVFGVVDDGDIGVCCNLYLVEVVDDLFYFCVGVFFDVECDVGLGVDDD